MDIHAHLRPRGRIEDKAEKCAWNDTLAREGERPRHEPSREVPEVNSSARIKARTVGQVFGLASASID
jgi:hypothetical protein